MNLRLTKGVLPITEIAFSKRAQNMLVAIGASTGGTEAILEVITRLPATAPGIIITQHMPEVFTDMYAKRLDKLSALEVREAKHGDFLRPGLCLISPGGKQQVKVVKVGSNYSVHCYDGPKVSGHCPSVDVLFSSVAMAAGENAIGVILTGMGDDGARGMLSMRKNGAYTIGQNEQSSVVYGMPMEAKKLGGVVIETDVERVAEKIVSYLLSLK